MTKLLVCEMCSDIITPLVGEWRSCMCGRHKSKFADDQSTLLVYDYIKVNPPDFVEYKPACFVLGIHNGFLRMPNSGSKSYIQYMKDLMDNTEDHYLFKQWNSFIVKVWPWHFGNDIKWVDKID